MTPELFDTLPHTGRRVLSLASKRNAAGVLIENVAARILSAVITSNTATESICPDLCLPQNNAAVEVKASVTGRWVVYPWRVKREQEWVEAQRTIFNHTRPFLYALVSYTVKPGIPDGDMLLTDESPNRIVLFGFSILSGFTITLCSLMEVQEAVAPLKVRKAKGAEGSRGDNRPGYSEGYVELRRKDLPAFRVEQCASLHGLPFSVQLTTGALLSFSHNQLTAFYEALSHHTDT